MRMTPEAKTPRRPAQHQTARQIIESRIGRKLPPAADLPPDLREAVKRLAIQRIKARMQK